MALSSEYCIGVASTSQTVQHTETCYMTLLLVKFIIGCSHRRSRDGAGRGGAGHGGAPALSALCTPTALAAPATHPPPTAVRETTP
ncbi:hypothetical protein EVAR_23276_1 [Eumeta japonica]|uniref:Uncharacterized protein n=1 Tax=Eumeta variegata TaxID=151549 RepID=A0A4C1V5P7_EUMVA|nr:hypothetical protein EVAR_23276_1 [Eumeta japonica]